MEIDIKFAFSLIGIALTIIAYIPYLRGIYLGDTKPHAYTWLIWCLTVGTAAAGMLVGGAGLFATGPFIIGTVLVFAVFLLSLKYGTRSMGPVCRFTRIRDPGFSRVQPTNCHVRRYDCGCKCNSYHSRSVKKTTYS